MSKNQDTLIAPICDSIITSARASLTTYDGRVTEFNVAAWLQAPGLSSFPVSLLVRYSDGGAQREVFVDHGKLNAKGKILLAGIARLPFKKKIEAMKIHLRSAVPIKGLLVDELFVQAVETVETRADRLQA
ncbi:hypothetical protein [Metapseudomonas boanensis]|uniref:Uncharacterized protein n=1 Tax=Metapseudomonas boanensis TaxID=2822138 RepID=A0ABS5XIV4_9GAMM|nr:hypothetical protein [Pseudomonas boanensis]MBT8767609.1 hypothetical protein [Pseudomonas boanensis]